MKFLLSGIAALAVLLLTGCREARDTGELLEQSSRQLAAGKYTQALATADLAVRNAPGRVDALLMRAIAQERTGRPDLALSSALEAEKLAPASFAVQYTLGRLYAADRKTYPQALMALSKALAIRPGDRNVLILQANVYMGLRPAYAMQILKQLQRDTALASGAGYCNELGVSQLLCGKVRDGGVQLNLAVMRAPRNPVFRLNYARYLDFYAKQPTAALVHYQTYLGLSQNLAGHDHFRKWTAARCSEIQGRRR